MVVSDAALEDMGNRRREERRLQLIGEEEDIVDIDVIGDGGWGKRSLGHGYDSLTGSCIISL